jgi:arylsulfatase A-like enzyme
MSSIAKPKVEFSQPAGTQVSQVGWSRQPFVTAAAALLFLITRLAFGLLCLVTSVYCLLLYIPFSYYGFIHDPILWWLPAFVRLHAYLYGITLSAIAVTLIPDLRKPATRVPVAAFLLMNAALSLYFILFSDLRHLGPDFAAYTWSIFGLFPVVWLGAIDAACAGAPAAEQRSAIVARRSPDLASLGFSAIAVASGFAAVSMIRDILGSGQHLSHSARWLGIFASFSAHVGIFVIVGGCFLLVAKCSAWFRRSELVYSLLAGILTWGLCSLAVLKIALPTLSFTGIPADLVSCAVGLAVVVGVVGTVSRVKLRVLELAGSSGKMGAWMLGLLTVSFLPLAYSIPSVIAKTDWDFVLQKFAVLLLWTSVYMFLGKADIAVRKGRLPASGLAVVITLTTVIGFYKLNSDARGESRWDNLVEAYAGSDISFKTAADILSRSLDNSSHDNFYQFLRQHTNISAEITAPPAAVELVSSLAPGKMNKPNIFIFVIDSLRQDYVPHYSSSATFTPEIARFADDSIEFKKAFTRYAGTALSEPAIWVGAMQAHKQYIQPFYPMNNLETLLQNEGYDSFVSVDGILGLMFSPSFPVHRLDEHTKNWGELDFVPTLAEIQRDIDARPDKAKPIFVYTQPQNVHTVTMELTKHGSTRREMSIYELKRIDKAFGEFIGFLKNRGMYENSIIVLTSDHGDAYGEFGRYGHCDFLFPEVIRIPLVIHLPSEMRRKMVWDSESVAFSLDVTPSIYYLLGHRPILNNELLGRPLFTETQAERQAYVRKDYLLASSYAAVYGILSDDGDSLFIADAVNHRGYFYDFSQDPAGTRNEINARRWNEGENEVRRQILLLDQAYDIHFAN